VAGKRARRHPQRTCVGCHRIMPKRELTRIVRKPDGEITIDPTGKVSGRGAYLCGNRECWLKALKHKGLERALKVPLTRQQRETIEAFAAELPDVSQVGV